MTARRPARPNSRATKTRPALAPNLDARAVEAAEDAEDRRAYEAHRTAVAEGKARFVALDEVKRKLGL